MRDRLEKGDWKTVDEKANVVKVAYRFEAVGDKAKNLYKPVLADNGLSPKELLRISWDEPTGSALRRVQATFEFKIGESTLTIPPKKSAPLELIATNGSFEIKGEQLKWIVNTILKSLEGQGFSPGKLLPAALESSSIKLNPVSPPSFIIGKTHAVKEVSIRSVNQVRVRTQAGRTRRGSTQTC